MHRHTTTTAPADSPLPPPTPALQSKPCAKLRREGNKPRSLVRQTAVSYNGSIVVAAHEDGSVTRYDRQARGGGAGGGSQEEPMEEDGE